MYSYWPDQAMETPGGSLTSWSTARRASVGPCLGAETVRQAGQLDRQLVRVDDLVFERAAQGDLGGRHQAQIAVLHRVDLRFRPARIETDPFQHLITGQVRRDQQRKPFRTELLDGKLHQRQFQQDRLILEVVKSATRHPRSRLEVDQVG